MYQPQHTTHRSIAHLLMSLLLLIPHLVKAEGDHTKHHVITVFIHGTVGAATTLWYGFWLMLYDAFDGTSGCEKRVLRERISPRLKHDEFMLDLGLVAIDPQNIPYNRRNYAAYHIVRAFAACTQAEEKNHPQYHYYTFGWNGLLSETGRQTAAHTLHSALQQEYTRLQANDGTVSIQVYAHSHGCQLILYLAKAALEAPPEERLQIDCAILSGAPLYYNAAQYILTGTCKKILNIYSEGDFVQQLDVLSIPDAFCKRRFTDLLADLPHPHEPPNCQVIDIRLEGEYCPYFFGHFSFFTLNRYALIKGRNRSYNRVYRALLDELTPIPLVALYPLLIDTLGDYPMGVHEATVNIGLCNDRLAMVIHPTERMQDTKIVPVPDAFYTVRDETRAYYAELDHINRFSSPIRSR